MRRGVSEQRSCAVSLGNQESSSGAAKLHFLTAGHRLIFPSLLPSPIPPPRGMIIFPPIHCTIIFQVCSYPSLLSFFMACFYPCAGLHIYVVSVQYVKVLSVCSVQKSNKNIFIFFAGDLQWGFFLLLLVKSDQLKPCILTNMTAVYALPSKAFYSPGEQNYTSEGDCLFFLL